ncbi:MAG: ATP synthase F1 subunit delta [Nitrospinaceae bacterium]
MIENQIGKRFAEALSDAIEDTNRLHAALESLTAMAQAFAAEINLHRFFIHPSFPEDRKQALVEELCARFKAGAEVRNLMRLLVERKKVPYVKNVAAYFETFVDRRLNQVRVQVVSAQPLGRGALNKLKTSLDRLLGKTAILEVSVDASLLGGVKLMVGSRVADATVKNRLAQLKHVIQSEEVLSELASG